MVKKRLVLGPSHIMRWIQSIDCAVIPKVSNTEFHGRGGAPIWGDFIKNKSKDFALYDEIVFIVGDFRFGNKTLIDDYLPRNQHGIEKSLISEANDRVMYQKVIDELSVLVNSNYKNKIKFIFWDLALREFHNKKNDKYCNSYGYEHPIWNLDHLQNLFVSNTVKINSKINLGALFIDGSNHPSFLGYVYLNFLIFGGEYTQKRIDIYPSFRLSERKIVGDSTLVKHVNMFCEKGILDSSYLLDEVKISSLDRYLSINNYKITFVSNLRQLNDNQDVFSRRFQRLYSLKVKYGDRLNILFWESFAQEVIAIREKSYLKFIPDNPFYKHSTISSIFDNQNVYPIKSSLAAQSLVELNVGLQPTIKAILWLFMLHDHSLNDFEGYYLKLRDSYFQ